MADKPFPLKARVPIGVDENNRPIAYPSADFIRLWDALFKRIGEYTALSNTELEALVNRASASEMLMQPTQGQQAIETLMQPAPPGQIYEDLMQPAMCGFFYDPIFQG